MMFITRALHQSSSQAFLCSLLHTTAEGKDSPGKEDYSSGQMGRSCIPEGKKTHMFYSIASNRCAIQVVGMGNTNTAGQEGGVGVAEQVSAAQWTAGLTFTAAARGSLVGAGATWAKSSPASCGWMWPVGMVAHAKAAWPPKPEQNPVSVNRC